MPVIFYQSGLHDRFDWDYPNSELHCALRDAETTVRANPDLIPQYIETTKSLVDEYAIPAIRDELRYSGESLRAKAYELAFENDPAKSIVLEDHKDGYVTLWAVNRKEESCQKIGLTTRPGWMLTTLYGVLQDLKTENPETSSPYLSGRDKGLSRIVEALEQIVHELLSASEGAEREILQCLKESFDNQRPGRGRRPNPSEIYRNGVSERERSRKEWAENFLALKQEWHSGTLN